MTSDEEDDFIRATVEAIVVLRQFVPAERRNHIASGISNDPLEMGTITGTAVAMVPYAPLHALRSLRGAIPGLPASLTQTIDAAIVAKSYGGTAH